MDFSCPSLYVAGTSLHVQQDSLFDHSARSGCVLFYHRLVMYGSVTILYEVAVIFGLQHISVAGRFRGLVGESSESPEASAGWVAVQGSPAQ